MDFCSPLLAAPVISDIIIDGSAPHHHPIFDPNFVRMHHELFEWAAFLIFFAICAAACFGLWKLFRNRSKNANTAPGPKRLANQ